tara:strand:+ start:8428 stop:9090 length:663 start_codon:yes stop_codon:yes gene_type:complete
MTHSFNTPVSWSIKKEPIYRILDDVKWMENFFETGELMLSCFNNFKSYKDEMQGDLEEGHGVLGNTDEKGNVSAYIYDSGSNAYVMSTTTVLTDIVKKDFKGKCAIKIMHPTYFALEISKKLPYVLSGLEGHCDYLNTRVHFLEKEVEYKKSFEKLDFENDRNSIELFKEMTNGKELFLKDKKYRHQNEYRLIWFSKEYVNESVVIKCPEARSFCEPLTF